MTRVVVVGGGIAALEFVLALHDLAPGRHEVVLVAPDVMFTLRPMAVARPFARGTTGRLPLDDVLAEHGGRLHAAAVVRVDVGAKEVVCDDGTREPYDHLVLAIGARRTAPFEHALTFGMTADRDALNGVLADLEEGHSRSVAFVVPEGTAWTLPLYELALMTAEELRGMGRDAVEVHLVTPETRPLEAFGPEASDAVADALDAAGVVLHTGVAARVPAPRRVDFGPGVQLRVDRIVTLPGVVGPELAGLPRDSAGFLPVDAWGRVEGHHDIHAVGDATAGPLKQGGIASQQADRVAEQLAAGDVGEAPAPPPLVLRGRLLTGGGDRFLSGGDGAAVAGRDAPEPWWPATKVVARYLGPYLERRGVVDLPVRAER